MNMTNPAHSTTEIYQFRIYLQGISPMIWRRLWLRSDQTLAHLHHALQISFGWSDMHLHCFRHRLREYGIPRIGGPFYTEDARHVRLLDLKLRPGERLLYDYNFHVPWVHDIRLEKQLLISDSQIRGNDVHQYPVCLAGARQAPPEECSSAWHYMSLRQYYSVFYIADRIIEILQEIDANDVEDVVLDMLLEELEILLYWAQCDEFDRKDINQRLWQCCIQERT